jgi:hypothetical protein
MGIFRSCCSSFEKCVCVCLRDFNKLTSRQSNYFACWCEDIKKNSTLIKCLPISLLWSRSLISVNHMHGFRSHCQSESSRECRLNWSKLYDLLFYGLKYFISSHSIIFRCIPREKTLLLLREEETGLTKSGCCVFSPHFISISRWQHENIFLCVPESK